jgi:hypothetical protein
VKRETRRSWDKAEPRLGKARHSSFQDIAEEEGFAVGVTEERQEIKFCEGGEGDGGHIDVDRLREGKDSVKVIVDNVDGGEVRVGGDNRMKQSVDSLVGRAAVLVPTSYPTSILSPPIVHLTLLFCKLWTSSHFSFTIRFTSR